MHEVTLKTGTRGIRYLAQQLKVPPYNAEAFLSISIQSTLVCCLCEEEYPELQQTFPIRGEPCEISQSACVGAYSTVLAPVSEPSTPNHLCFIFQHLTTTVQLPSPAVCPAA
jgi:hypothetical protein